MTINDDAAARLEAAIFGLTDEDMTWILFWMCRQPGAREHLAAALAELRRQP